MCADRSLRTSIVVVGGACCAYIAARCVAERRKVKKLLAASVGGTFVKLTFAEEQHADAPSQSTSTIYEGACPEVWLRQRVAEIVRVNPWLAGRLKTDPATGKLALWVPDRPDCDGFLEIVQVADEAAVTGNSSPDLFVKCGLDLVDRDEPACRMVVLTEPSRTRWGLQISMSHVLTDSHTFYSVYAMLDKSNEIWPMEVQRLPGFHPLHCLKGSPRHGKWLFWIKQAIGRKLWLPKDPGPIYTMRYVLMDWVEEQKREAVERGLGPDAPFLSDNDVLTSWFFRATGSPCAGQAINMRNRCEGLTDRHAGVYTTMLLYYPEEYKDPANIRRSVTRQSHACMPDGSKQRPGPGAKCGSLFSWHAFYCEVHFDGCRELGHFPIFAVPIDPRNASFTPACVVFRPAPGRLAVTALTNDPLPDGGPLGEPVWGSDAFVAAMNAASG